MYTPAANPSSAALMEPRVTAMCSQDRNVRSLAKNVLGSIFMCVERATLAAAPVGASRPAWHRGECV